MRIGDGVTVCYWTDRKAYTVIRMTPHTLTLQRDKVTHANGYKPEYIPGGFGAHCTNNAEQKWEYSADPEGEIVRAYWHPSQRCFMVNKTLKVVPGRHEFYDYNF